MANQNEELKRLGIYKNRIGQTIYQDRWTKVVYIIQESDIKKIKLLSNRLFLAIAGGVLTYAFLLKDNFIAGTAVAVGLYLILELFYRFSLIPSFQKAKKLDGVEFFDAKKARDNQNKNQLIFKFVAYWGLSAFIIILTYISEYPMWQKVSIYGLAAFAIYNGVLNFLSFIKQKDNVVKK